MAERADEADFYVGYLRTPLRLVRFLAILVTVVLVLVDAVALLLYRAQEARSSGDWGSEGEVAYDGVLVAKPYPLVLVPASGRSPAYAVLLVSEGKAGAMPGLGPLDGKAVTVQGYRLLRDGLTVLQLSQRPRARPAVAAAVAGTPLGPRTLTGEIADSKCFLGAMNPGEGKVHEACAGLCLLGGIPPLFITRESAGKLNYRLLADENGGALPEAASHAGEFLTLTGTLTRLDGIEIFAVTRAALEKN